MTPANIYYIFHVEPGDSGMQRKMIAKFLLNGNHFEVLEDHGLPEGFHELAPAQGAALIHRYTHSMYYNVVNLQDILEGHHPEFIEDPTAKESIDDDMAKVLGKKVSSGPASEDFDYDRMGGEGPRVLSVSDGNVFLDGHLLEGHEIDKIQENVRTGKALMRRRLAKSIFNEGMDPRMDKFLHEDSVIPGVGNLRAYNQFTNKTPPGVHIHIDGNDIRHLNRTYGQEVGNKAVRALGSAIGETARTLVGNHAGVFRLGSDKFAVHVPNMEAASLFARGLRTHLENVPSIKGTHNFAVSMGMGPDSGLAKQGLEEAKAQRRLVGYQPGQSKTHVVIKSPSTELAASPDSVKELG